MKILNAILILWIISLLNNCFAKDYDDDDDGDDINKENPKILEIMEKVNEIALSCPRGIMNCKSYLKNTLFRDIYLINKDFFYQKVKLSEMKEFLEKTEPTEWLIHSIKSSNTPRFRISHSMIPKTFKGMINLEGGYIENDLLHYFKGLIHLSAKPHSINSRWMCREYIPKTSQYRFSSYITQPGCNMYKCKKKTFEAEPICCIPEDIRVFIELVKTTTLASYLCPPGSNANHPICIRELLQDKYHCENGKNKLCCMNQKYSFPIKDGELELLDYGIFSFGYSQIKANFKNFLRGVMK